MLKKLTLLLVVLFVVACGSSAESIPSMSDSAETIGNVMPGEMAAEAPVDESGDFDMGASDIDRETRSQQTQRLIIKTGSMNVEVEDIDIAVGNATSYVVGLGGYLQSQNVSGSGRFKSATLTLGVPVDQFENAMATFREYGEVGSENASGQDVTEEYVDLNSRMTNLEATQTRLRELYEEARNVEETLEVDRELRRIEEEINVIQGRINYLADRAAFSTITLNFSFVGEPIVTEPEAWNLGFTTNQAVSDLVATAQRWADGLVYFAIAVLPFLLIFALFVWIIYRIVRSIYRRTKRVVSSVDPSPTDSPAT